MAADQRTPYPRQTRARQRTRHVRILFSRHKADWPRGRDHARFASPGTHHGHGVAPPLVVGTWTAVRVDGGDWARGWTKPCSEPDGRGPDTGLLRNFWLPDQAEPPSTEPPRTRVRPPVGAAPIMRYAAVPDGRGPANALSAADPCAPAHTPRGSCGRSRGHPYARFRPIASTLHRDR
jgi:hypothetical protein